MKIPSATSFKNANSYLVKILLSNLSEKHVVKFEQQFPEHQDAVDSFWLSRRQINVNDIDPEDVDTFLRALQRCSNLKELTMNWTKSVDVFKGIPNIISICCPKLEVFDFEEVVLSEEDVATLSSLTKLKKIRICVPECSTASLENLLVNNPQVEDLKLGCDIEDAFLDALPRTITKLYLWKTFNTWYSRLMPKIETLQLEELSLPDLVLKGEDIRRIAQQGTLRSIYLWFNALDSDLGLLFSNNPRLEKVRLMNDADNHHGACLAQLPNTLKKLKLLFFSNIPEKDLVKCFKTCKIDELWLHGGDSQHNYLPEVVKVAIYLEELLISCDKCSAENLSSIQQLKQLKSLDLNGLLPEHEDAICAIRENCTALEDLTANTLWVDDDEEDEEYDE